ERMARKRRHLGQVLDIERRVYPRPWTMALFLSEIVQRSTRFYIVARAARRVVGYGGLMAFGDEAHITNVAVDPDHHRRKVASRVMFALVTEARRRGATACTLEVRVANHKAQHLYQQVGFPPVGNARTTTRRPARTRSSCGRRACAPRPTTAAS